MWAVYDNENGLSQLFEKREDAVAEYNEIKSQMEDWAIEDGFGGSEQLALVKVELELTPYDTKEPVIEEDEDGNEYETKDTYWTWQEKTY